MLLKLYYIYAKSPKKSRELAEVVTDLKDVFSFPDSCDTPVRSQGSHWIAHKHKALQHVMDRYGTYISHVSALVADHSVNSSDKAQLRVYLKKLCQAKFLVGAALYVAVLKSPSLLSLSLQENDLNAVMGIKHILKSVKALKSAAQHDPSLWPTLKLVCSKIVDEKVYEGATRRPYNTANSRHWLIIGQLNQKMRDRLE